MKFAGITLLCLTLASGCASSPGQWREDIGLSPAQTTRNESSSAANLALIALGAQLMQASGPQPAPQQRAVYDYDWDWDQFYHNNTLIWMCRGVQTGRFAEETRCAYKAKMDFRWPDKWAQ